MKLLEFAKVVAEAFVVERKSGLQMKLEIEKLKAAIADLEAKLGEHSDEAEAAILALQEGLDYTPVVDAVAEALKEDASVDTAGTAIETTPEVTDNAEVTPAPVAEEVVTAVVESVAAEEGVAVTEEEVAEVAAIASNDAAVEI